jgi:amino acid adenylation domain-containing protein
MLETTNAVILLTSHETVVELSGFSGKTLFIEDESPLAPLPAESTAGALAYVMFTSGSTGEPKAVAVTHRSVVRLVRQTNFAHFGPDQVFLLLSPASFDASTLELWAPLLNGGRLAIAPPGPLALAEIAALITTQHVSTLWLTASLFQQMADQHPHALRCLRQLIAGGDVLSPIHVRRVLDGDPGLTVINGYGPTENTTFTCCHPIASPDAIGDAVPIGRPIARTTAYILDSQLRPVPPWVAGELYTGGDGLALGYLNAPDATAERFVPDPFHPQPGRRMYRTGDVARWRDDGVIEFLGRADRQLKVRGFRIEPREIERHLLEHPAVRDAVVDIHTSEDGDRRLFAWVVPDRSAPADDDHGAEQVAGWECLFDEHIYRAGTASEDPLFNTSGWISSYDGSPIPVTQMRTWAADIVSQVRALNPESILEIGCGTGMLLFSLAPHCVRYHGTDFSQVSLDYVAAQIEANRPRFDNVTLARLLASDFTGIEPNSFDVVILSSVVQYFPSLDYLLTVIEGSLRVLKPDGTIFLGDIRSLPLLHALHTEIESRRDDDERDLRQRVESAIARETELCLDPALFPALAARYPQISFVQLRLERGRELNELVRYRYHALLHAGPREVLSPPRAVDAGSLTIEEIAKLVAQPVTLTAIRNGRIAPGGIDPEDLRDLAESVGCALEISWSVAGPDRFDAAFVPRASAGTRLISTPIAQSPAAAHDLSRYANRPASSSAAAQLLTRALSAWLSERLPSQMVPSVFIPLDALPLNSNGKIDRAALPIPGAASASARLDPPASPLQREIATIFTELLGIDSVAMHDNFFELGGHSLLATRLVSRLRDIFRLDVPLPLVFREPTVAGIAAWLQTHLASAALAEDRIPPSVDRSNPQPMSFAQERLWFLERTGHSGHAYNMPLHLQIEGPLNRNAFEGAIRGLVRRQESLRTVFRAEGGVPRQIVLPETAVDYEFEDLAHLPSVEQDHIVALRADAEHKRLFDLARGPLLRVRLLALSSNRHILLLTMHHIVSDGWSVEVMLREISELYRSLSTGQQANLASLDVHYADFARWQREMLQGDLLNRQMEYWKSHLAGLEQLALPIDFRRPDVETFRGAGSRFQIPPETTRELQRLGQTQGATLYMVLLAAFQALLARYSGQTRICVGSPIANRTRSEVENLVGFFVNSLVMCGDLAGNPNGEELLERTREMTLEAYANQDLPFERLVEELQPERTLSRNPIFQVAFALQQTAAMAPRFDIPGFRTERLTLTEMTVRFDIELHVWPEDRGLQAWWVYNADLFDPRTIRRMADHWLQILARLAQDPSQSLSQLLALPDAEREHLLHTWNQTETPWSAITVPELFADQAARTPFSVAIESGPVTLTYQDLDRRSNAVARSLIARGVRPEDIVALSIERSPELIVAQLGVLKAGAVYLPLDPADASQRRAAILAEAHVAAVLEAADIEGETSLPTHTRLDPANLVYINFTSGSSGVPKGIGVTHESIVRLVANANYVHISAADRVAHAAHVSFDASTFEVWGALLHGARVVVLSRETIVDPRAFAEELRERRITTMFLTTSLFNRMADERPHAFASLRQLFFGGEAVDVRRVRKILEGGRPQRLVHVYGPTECTTFSTWHEVSPADLSAATIPIGLPISNARAYVLDDLLHPVPVGVAGELFISGPGVARGYVHRPAQTAELFLPDPFSAHPGSRMYRTGDRVRRRPDGAIEFLGRIDSQLKIRGLRIDPGEIEAALIAHPGVREAAVIARQSADGEKQLAAYLAPTSLPGRPDRHVESWAAIFDQHIYSGAAPAPDPLFNSTGWVSHRDGSPIPDADMRAWAKDIVDTVRFHHPSRILEIGCGTGMLLFQLAQNCIRYCGTDISPIVLDYVRTQAAHHGARYSHIELDERQASDFSGFEDGSFDVVLLSSVVQYFPDANYFFCVLEGSLRVLRPGGAIVLGDLRNLALLEAFHRTLPDSGIQERELFIHPAYFAHLGTRLPALGAAQVRLQRSPAVNELTRFRYTAVLRKQPVQPSLSPPQVSAPEGARTYLSSHAPAGVCIRNLKNALLSADPDAVYPEELRGIATELGYDCEICWSPDAADRIDAAFAKPGHAPLRMPLFDTTDLPAWEDCTNQPVHAPDFGELQAELREHLAHRLPDYMIPARIVVLDRLPLTPSGKVDRKALPSIEPDQQAAVPRSAPSGSPLEQIIARAFSDLLGVPSVSPDDDFFHLGGHSLLATRLVSRIRDLIGVEIPLRTIFESPTVAGIAESVTIEQFNSADPAELLELLEHIEGISDESAARMLGKSANVA